MNAILCAVVFFSLAGLAWGMVRLFDPPFNHAPAGRNFRVIHYHRGYFMLQVSEKERWRPVRYSWDEIEHWCPHFAPVLSKDFDELVTLARAYKEHPQSFENYLRGEAEKHESAMNRYKEYRNSNRRIFTT